MRKIFLLLAMMGTVWGVDVKEAKTTPVKSYTTFNERVADIAGAPYEPFYNNSTLPVNGHLQIPATFKGQMLGSSKFTSYNNSSADTLEFLGSGWKFSDGCFGDSLVVRFSPGAVSEKDPAWWGFSTSASGATNAKALNASFVGGGRITINAGTYNVDKIVCNDTCIIEGAGMGRTFLKSNATGDSSAIFNAIYTSIKDLTIDGNKKASCVRISSILQAELKNVLIRNHTSKSCWVSGFEVKIDHCRFYADTANGATPYCALYVDWNAIEISGQTYFNTQNKCPAVVIGDIFKVKELRSVTIENNTFEASPIAIVLSDSINSSGINILNNYFEMTGATTAEIMRVTRGTHQSINIVGNHSGTGVKNSFVFDRINKQSHVNISGNDMYRPIRIYTDTVALTNFNVTDLPAVNIQSQHKLYSAADFTSPTKPTVIVDDYVAFESLCVERSVYSGYDYGYPKITGRFFCTSTYDTITQPFSLLITTSGGAAYANAFDYMYDIDWRRANTATTGVSSTEIEKHKISGVVRNATVSMQGFYNTTTLRSSTEELSNANITMDHSTNQLVLNIIGDPLSSLNQWFIDFEIKGVQ